MTNEKAIHHCKTASYDYYYSANQTMNKACKKPLNYGVKTTQLKSQIYLSALQK